MESLYEVRKISAHKPNKAMLGKSTVKASGTVSLIHRVESAKNKIDRSKIAAAIRADRDSR